MRKSLQTFIAPLMFAFALVFAMVFGFAQPSEAKTPIIRILLCRLLGVDTGECAPDDEPVLPVLSPTTDPTITDPRVPRNPGETPTTPSESEEPSPSSSKFLGLPQAK
ncbi:hypothetical protein Cri9333_4928 (plasmid) [Crinalium epipsammum PCC 9333]|uniref:Uncharacterized protein n=1 Tax=Crinalium epipsammum PCC 9333 TaxID=1173022 RepID=K9W885_9CYAN|nr:hypothetical protein [Crinalium epipsammum]AFZ15685.1 hypothetical protein Cri9333_4928 [Crinalium epipsammum PCC 9333]